MYSRDCEGRTLDFEPSGGLLNASLVMQDRQTDSYWSIMTGDSVGGELEGTRLEELPVGVKTQWKDWVRQHPDTLVLSVGGVEDPMLDPYEPYYADDAGFREWRRATDERLETKTPIYAFMHGDKKYAVPLEAIEGGRTWKLDDGATIFLFRPEGAELFMGTASFVIRDGGFERRGRNWLESASGARFDYDAREFVGAEVERLPGFDTFWYTWSLTHPDTEVLR